MLAYQHDQEEYAVESRNLPVQNKQPRSGGYSTRFERRRAKPGSLSNGAQHRRNKRCGL